VQTWHIARPHPASGLNGASWTRSGASKAWQTSSALHGQWRIG
jgi:hypothetical protein